MFPADQKTATGNSRQINDFDSSRSRLNDDIALSQEGGGGREEGSKSKSSMTPRPAGVHTIISTVCSCNCLDCRAPSSISARLFRLVGNRYRTAEINVNYAGEPPDNLYKHRRGGEREAVSDNAHANLPASCGDTIGISRLVNTRDTVGRSVGLYTHTVEKIQAAPSSIG